MILKTDYSVQYFLFLFFASLSLFSLHTYIYSPVRLYRFLFNFLSSFFCGKSADFGRQVKIKIFPHTLTKYRSFKLNTIRFEFQCLNIWQPKENHKTDTICEVLAGFFSMIYVLWDWVAYKWTIDINIKNERFLSHSSELWKREKMNQFNKSVVVKVGHQCCCGWLFYIITDANNREIYSNNIIYFIDTIITDRRSLKIWYRFDRHFGKTQYSNILPFETN